MPVGLILLHLALISAGIVLLTLVCSTGNAMRLAPATLWIVIDLMVSIAGVAFVGSPEYRVLIPRLAAFHFVAMAACLIWLWIDAARGAHPLANVFLGSIAAYAATRVLLVAMFFMEVGGVWALELVNSLVYLAAVGLMIASLLLPVPPETQPDVPCISPVSQMPCPGLAREARR